MALVAGRCGSVVSSGLAVTGAGLVGKLGVWTCPVFFVLGFSHLVRCVKLDAVIAMETRIGHGRFAQLDFKCTLQTVTSPQSIPPLSVQVQETTF